MGGVCINSLKKSLTAAKKSNIAATKISITTKSPTIKQEYYNDNAQSPITSSPIFSSNQTSPPIRSNKRKFSIFTRTEDDENASNNKKYKQSELKYIIQSKKIIINYVRNDIEIRRIATITFDENELILISRNFIKFNYIIIQPNFSIRSNVPCEPENILLNNQISKIEKELKIYVFQKITNLNANGAAPIN
jgi:hypothetical protein